MIASAPLCSPVILRKHILLWNKVVLWMTLTSVEKEVHHLNWSHGVMEIDGTVWYSRHPWHHLALVGISCKANYVCQANCCGLCPYQCFHLLSRSLYFLWVIMLLSFYWFSSAVVKLLCIMWYKRCWNIQADILL